MRVRRGGPIPGYNVTQPSAQLVGSVGYFIQPLHARGSLSLWQRQKNLGDQVVLRGKVVIQAPWKRPRPERYPQWKTSSNPASQKSDMAACTISSRLSIISFIYITVYSNLVTIIPTVGMFVNILAFIAWLSISLSRPFQNPPQQTSVPARMTIKRRHVIIKT
jgi:hypothetical protein